MSGVRDAPVSPRGTVLRLFGAILIMLAALNAMLSWRGGLAVNALPVWTMAAGTVLCLIGNMRRASRGAAGSADAPQRRNET